MTIIQALVLSIVEGLTEFLPVSSTGHLVIAQSLMGMEPSDFTKAFTVMIQFGAILSVVVLYFRRFIRFELPSDRIYEEHKWIRFVSRFRFYLLLMVGLVPAVVLGLLFNDWVDRALGSVWIIAMNLVIGGVIMLFIDRVIRLQEHEKVNYPRAFWIGLSQCVAMFLPGMSRSMSTIVGGMACGLSRKTAAEFSFFLAVPTMFGASVLEVIKFWKSGKLEVLQEHIGLLVIGNVASFVVALIAIKFFIGYVQKHSFRAFGVYRIIIGAVILLLLVLGKDLAIV